MQHKFKIGQIVRFTPGAHERSWGGMYQVVACLPVERGDRQCHQGGCRKYCE